MQFTFSWVELHGAITHFPIVLLLGSVFADTVAVVFRNAEWRHAGLAMLIAAVISCVPALVTGYFTGRSFGSFPPVGFESHWIAAVSTSVVASLLLVWRLIGRDRLGQVARLSSLGVALVGAAAVSFTGYSGGQMVFGGAAPAIAISMNAKAKKAKAPVASKALIAQGNKLFHSDAVACISCHKVGLDGGSIGPNLTKEGLENRGVAWQLAHLKDPVSKVAGSRMPGYGHLQARDLNAIVAYLESLK